MQDQSENELEVKLGALVRSNIDAFFSDLCAGTEQDEISKSVRDTREAERVDHAWTGFVEDMELATAGGRNSHQPRLRSEQVESDEPTWHPGDDPNLGLGEPLEKIFTGGALSTGVPGTQKIVGDWIYVFGPDGTVRRCYHKNTDPRIFDTIQE